MQGFIKRRQSFAGLLKQRQADLHITADKAMREMGMAPTTYKRRVKNPSTITVMELAAFKRVYQLTDEVISDLLESKYI